jgi:hypothetical protein
MTSHHYSTAYGTRCSFSVKLVEQILPFMTLHGQFRRNQRVLLPR